MLEQKPYIVPVPKKLIIEGNEYFAFKGSDHIIYRQDSNLPSEGYNLEISKTGVSITSSSAAGAYYGKVTLNQILSQYGNQLPCLRIEDAPDFENRGVMLDIGRDKIPSMKSIYELIDMLSELKYNELQLYMEGYAFEYKEFKRIFSEETPITAEEYKLLDAYARKRFIKLVPNQNCFGHMAPWLAKDEFKELAENNDGIEFVPGLKMPSSTLNPLDPKTLELVTKMFDELLPNFSADVVNINFDEPFELGTGKSREACAERGLGTIYLEYLLKVCDIVKKHGKKPMFWGDIILKHPELVKQLPKDITVLDWNYEGFSSFEPHCKLLSDCQVPFYVCPGTSAWGSIAGRTSNMKMNIFNAAKNGKKYGANGILITDWGDLGHWHTPVISYPGYVLGAAAGWNVSECKDADIEGYLDRYIFKDSTSNMGKMALELGEYSKFEKAYFPNYTLTFSLLAIQGLSSREELENRIKGLLGAIGAMMGDASIGQDYRFDYDVSGLNELLNRCEAVICIAKMDNDNALLITEEYKNTIGLLRHAANLINFILNEDKLEVKEKLDSINGLRKEISEFIANYERVWRARNREGGLKRSSTQFYNLQKQYEEKQVQITETIGDY
jgi:hexosaminidase